MTSRSKNKRARYDARVEYRAVQPEIEQMFDQGHSLKSVFEKMTQAGQITISYTTFCDYARGGGQRLRKGGRQAKSLKRSGGPTQRQPGSGAAAARGDASGPFVYDRDIDISELA
jgi:hypothetical protein